MKKQKKIFKAISILIYIITAILIIFVGYLIYMKVTNSIPNLFGNSILRIVSNSMEDEIMTGDYILVKETNPKDIKIGDVIAFYSLDPAIYKQPNTHRVVEIINDNNDISYITKGDNNPIKDSYLAKDEYLIGKYERKLPVLSSLGNVLNNNYVFLFIIVVPAFILVIFEILNVIKKSKEIKQEELIKAEVERLKKENEEKKP
ncbi:MAG: signal peptidase I [Clostridia bacterium]